MLTPRQESILSKVVDGYLRIGQPVPSKLIAADPELDCSSSTVRGELALLEEYGLLAHPHTSAGRVPTDAGHRYVVDRILASGRDPSSGPTLQLSLMRQEVEDAMRLTTETLSRMTNLLAVVCAPPLNTARIRHIEVLALQPRVVMVVIITSTGGVSKMLTTFERPVDPGLITWAGEYLNDCLVGMDLGARMRHQRLADQSLSGTERAFLDHITSAFGDLADEQHDTLYVDGTAHLLSHGQLMELDQINDLMGLLERRVALLALLREALGKPDVYVRIGQENDNPAMRSMAIIAAGYGVARRRLGAVSVIGPVRMDYASAIATVREAASELSRFVEDAYAGS
ncbi:MAG: heat-inducible transcriptional repressor HrcA [Solirubrobacteraceae bacterium]